MGLFENPILDILRYERSKVSFLAQMIFFSNKKKTVFLYSLVLGVT